MNRKIAKKTLILYILDLLESGTSVERPVSITNITNALNQAKIPCDRRTVSRNIGYLIEYGKPIVKKRGVGVYYDHEHKYVSVPKE